MNVGNWLTQATPRLADKATRRDDALLPLSEESPRLDAELILAHALGRNRTWLYTWPDSAIDAGDVARADALLERRVAGEPLAYLTGVREFWSLPLEVSPDVLVPRPETELLVEQALAIIESRKRADAFSAVPDQACIIELGTGSGAIAIALATECHLPIIATDRSAKALQVARRNAERLVPGMVTLVQCDWLDAMDDGVASLIVSNPPYIADDDPHLQAIALRHEPSMALVAADNGLADMYQIVGDCRRVAQPGCSVLLEHGHTQGASVRRIMQAAGLVNITTMTDLSDNERVTIGVC